MDVSLLFPQQPTSPSAIDRYAEIVRQTGLDRLWMGQSFAIESHLAFAALAGTGRAVPVGIGTALAALRSPYDAALQARSLAALLGESVSVAYGAADPMFVSSVRGAPLARPASYTAEYARLVRGLIDGASVSSEEQGLVMRAQLPPLDHPPVHVGTGVLRPAMATKSRDADLAVSWLAPRRYLRDVIGPATRRADGSRPRLVAHAHCALARPGRNPELLAQVGCGRHLSSPHYTDMLRRAGLDVHPSDPVSGARQLVRAGVLLYGSSEQVAAELRTFADHGVDEVIVNVTPVALALGDTAAIHDVEDIVSALSRPTTPTAPAATGATYSFDHERPNRKDRSCP